MKFVKFTQFEADTIYINADLVCMVAPAEKTPNATHIQTVGEPSAFRGYGVWVEGSLEEVVRKLQSG